MRLLLLSAMFLAILLPQVNYAQKANTLHQGLSELDQQKVSELAMVNAGDYIVVGAYNNYLQAEAYQNEIKEYGFEGKVGYSVKYNLFYVYKDGVEDAQKNFEKVDSLRQTREFFDAWLYRLNTDEAVKNYEAAVVAAGDGLPKMEETKQPKEEIRHELERTDEEEHISELFDPSLKRWNPEIYNEYRLYIDLIDATTGDKIENGIVEAIDPKVHRLLHNLKCNQTQFLGINKRTGQEVEFETDAFGYRRKLRIVDLSNPVTEETQDFVEASGDSIIIHFQLEPHKKGDRFTMYKVFFHPDAAVMKPESSYELNQLLELLKNNENYHVRLIGHTNGNGMGKIIRPDDDNKNFFKINNNCIEGWGSAKKLSEERAKTIKRWLASNGISEDRVEIDGMGGKMMIFEEDDLVRAIRNVRVEVEILND